MVQYGTVQASPAPKRDVHRQVNGHLEHVMSHDCLSIPAVSRCPETKKRELPSRVLFPQVRGLWV